MRTYRKIAAIGIVLVTLVLTLSACGNKQLFDTTYNFNYGIVSLADGSVVEGRVSSWTDFEDGDMIQVKIDGVTYLVHSSNCTLMAE